MSAGTICGLCGGAADVEYVPGTSGGVAATWLTDCTTCGGPWTISSRDLPLLASENVDTKRRISSKVREHCRRDPATPFSVTKDSMLFYRLGR